MAKLEEFFSKTLTVIEHLVNTHVTWNGDLSKDEAKGIIDEARDFLNKEETDTQADNTEPVQTENEK